MPDQEQEKPVAQENDLTSSRMSDRMREFIEADLLMPGVPSADGTTFEVKPEVIAAVKADKAQAEKAAATAPAPPSKSEEDLAFEAAGETKPADWASYDAEKRYKHVQGFASRKANEAKQYAEQVQQFAPYKQWMDQLAPHAQYIQQALQEFYQRHTGQNAQAQQPDADFSDPQQLKAWMGQEIDRRAEEKARAILNSDPRIKLLQEGIELNQTRSANPDYDKYSEDIQLLKQKYPNMPNGEALRIAKDLDAVRAKRSSGEAGLADSPAKSQSPTTPEGQRLNREDLERTAASLPSNPGVSPTASRPVRPAQTLDQKMSDFVRELTLQAALGK